MECPKDLKMLDAGAAALKRGLEVKNYGFMYAVIRMYSLIRMYINAYVPCIHIREVY